MNRRLPVSIALTAVAAAAALLAVPSAARASTDPSGNIATTFPSSCRTAPTADDCENGVIADLNAARAKMGQPAYALPAGFDALPVVSQLVVLSNLDRAQYGLAPALGTNVTLNSAAQTAANASQDPYGPNTVDGVDFRGWSANVASGYPSALEAYYGWMYDDGPGGPNSECQQAGDSACWGHRHDTLMNSGSSALGMGVGTAVVNGSQVFTELYWYGASAISEVPVVTGISPASGATGTTVMVYGYGLGSAPAASFGGVAATPISTTATALKVLAPKGGSGDAAVRIAGRSATTGTQGGTSTAVDPATFTYAETQKVPGRTLDRDGDGSTGSSAHATRATSDAVPAMAAPVSRTFTAPTAAVAHAVSAAKAPAAVTTTSSTTTSAESRLRSLLDPYLSWVRVLLAVLR